MEAAAATVAERRALLLPCGADWYAVGLASVEEVVEGVRVTRLPGAPAAALGVVNVRGRVVPVLDLGLLLGVGAVRRVVAVAVVGTARGPAGLAVDGVPVAVRLLEVVGRSALADGMGRSRWRVGAAASGVATEIDVDAALAPERLR